MATSDARLDQVEVVSVPERIVVATRDALKEFGEDQCEGLVLWCGSVANGKAVVSGFMVPPQEALRGESGAGYFVDDATLFALNRYLNEHELRLIAQVHSHPHRAFHSRADDDYAIVTTEGGLSLVVPDFGDAPADPTSWAVFRLDQAVWRQLAQDEIRSLVKVEVDE